MRHKYIFVILFLVIFHSIFNYIWLKNDHYSFFSEKFYKLYEEHEFYMHLKESAYGSKEFIDRISRLLKDITDWPWQPRLFHGYTAILNYASGSDDMNNAVLWNIPFMSLALLFVYLIGKKIASPAAGFLSSLILSFYPGFYGMSRSYGIDFPIIAIMAVMLYHFIRVENFPSIRYVLEGAAIALLALLINGRSVFFLYGPFIYVMCQAIRDVLSPNCKRKKRKLLGICIALMLIGLITYLWWPKIRDMQQVLLTRLSLPTMQFSYELMRAILQRIQYFLINVAREISIFLTMFLLLGIAAFKNKKYTPFLASYCIAPLFIVSFFSSSVNRYFFPLFVGFALITGIGLASIKNHKWKKPVIYAVIFISIMQFFDLSFGTNFLPEKVFYARRSEWVAPPGVNDEAVAAERLLGAISDYSDTELDKVRVILAGNPMLIDSGVMQYIFLSKTDKHLLQRFFYCKKDELDVDFIIIVNEDKHFFGIPPVPDLSFLSKETFEGYFKMQYHEVAVSEELLEYMRGFFQAFKTIDYFTSGGRVYYLCVNPALDFS